MSYAAPIIHHDFTSSENKGALTGKFDIDNFDDIVVDTDNKQVGTASMYTGELGKSVANLGPDYSTPSDHKFTTGLTGGFFVSYWVKHGYSLTDSPFYYTKKTKAELIADTTLPPTYQVAHFGSTTSPDNANYVLGIVNQTYFNIKRSTGAILYGYNAISPTTITELLWAGTSTFVTPTTSVSTADGATTVGVYDGGEDFHHMVLSYHDMTTDVYVDGNLKTTYDHGNVGTDYIFNDTSFYKLSLGQTLLDTYINDFRVYNYTADTTMIDMIYKLGKNTDLASLSGAPMSSLQNAGATLSQLITAGISITELLNVYTVAELVAANVTIEQLVAGGVTAAQLSGHFTQTQIDIALTEIKIHSGFTINEGEQNESAFVEDAVYTPATFAAKLNTDLGYAENTITVDIDSTTTDSTPYYRMYLEFAEAVTLTNMPKYIFNIPFSDFSVKAGGQVNLRNVNLDAQMTINTSYTEDVAFEYHTVVECNASNYSNKNTNITTGEFDRYTNKIFDQSVFGTYTYWHHVAFSQTSIFAITMNFPPTKTKVFELDENEPYGMKQLGNDLSATTDELVISGDGLTVAMTSAGGGSNAGLINVFRRNLNEASGWESINDLLAGDLTGPSGSGKQRYASLSGDGNIIALGCFELLSKVRVFEYSGSGQSWTQLGTDITVPGTNHPVKISKDGNILCVMSVSAKSVSVYERDTNAASGWSQIGSTIQNLEEKIALNKNGDIFASFKSNSVISVYKRDTNDASGWSLMADITKIGNIVRDNGDNTLSLDDDGHTLTCGSPQDGNNKSGDYEGQGVLYFFKYNTTTSTWGPVVTNNTPTLLNPVNDDVWVNQIVEGGTGPIFGENSVNNTILNMQFAEYSAISGDGIHVIATNNKYSSFMYIYKLPHIATTSNTSTIPAGNHFINNFVSTIETDLDLPLSYDASNALIEFVGLGQDISMNITSNDTTIFDTTITEITAAANTNTLPFITYGQPDPTLTNYSDNGITTSEFISNGYTITQLFAAGVIPDWAFVTDANHFDQSYVKGFVDVSGSLVIRNDNKLITNGDLSLGGNLTVNSPGTTSFSNESMTLKSHLFMGEDISANSNVYVGGDLSVNGQFSGNFANGIIPLSAIGGGGGGGGGINISGNVFFTEDVSFNGPTVDVTNTPQVNQIEFNDGTTVSTHDDNILSGTFAGSNVVFKDSTFAQVTCEGVATADSKTTSDYRIKENVTDLNDTDTVDALVPIQYNNTVSGNHEFGLLAHELQEIYPDLVNGEKDGDEYQRVHYNGLIGVLVKEIQDLKQRLSVLNNR